MLRLVSINADHIINVIILHRVNESLNQLTVKLESIEIGTWVLVWNDLLSCFSVERVPSLLAETHNVGDLRACCA